MGHLAKLWQRDLGVDVADQGGAGAAGGLGGGLVAFCGATLQRGVESVARTVNLAERIAGADLVITGEGKLDAQSLRGKVPWGVGKAAKAAGVPTVAIAGQLGDGREEWPVLLDGWTCIIDRPMPLERALEDAPRLLRRAAEQMLRLYLLGRGRSST